MVNKITSSIEQRLFYLSNLFSRAIEQFLGSAICLGPEISYQQH